MDLTKYINFTRLISVLFGVVFLISGLLLNSMQLVLYIFVRPCSRTLFRKLNYYLNYSIASQLVFLHQNWAKMKIVLNSSKYDLDHFGKEHALVIMNHSYECDWAMGWILSDFCGILGNVKLFAKTSLQHIPVVGYAWKLSDVMFLERNWERDKKEVETKLLELKSYENPIWLVLMAEGTRFNEEKHEASKAFARQSGIPELRYHLSPRTKGFTTAVRLTRDKIKAVYNLNLAFEGGGVKHTLTNMLLGKSINAEFYLERIPMKDLPESEADLAAWLRSLYERKDDLIHSFLTTGNWRIDGKQYESFPIQRKIYHIVHFACWCAFVLLTLGFLLIRLAATGNFLSVSIVLGITFGYLPYLQQKIIEETKMSKASSYGIQQTT